MKGGQSASAESEPERFLEHSNRSTVYAIIRGMDDIDRIQSWVAYINGEKPQEYRWALTALKEQADTIRSEG